MAQLPQWDILPGVVERLYARSEVHAVYLGGSLGRGAGDAYSDLDLHVIVHAACTDFLTDAVIAQVMAIPVLAKECVRLGSTAWMHHLVLASGLVVDLLCRHHVPAQELSHLVPLDAACSQTLPISETRPKTWAPTTVSPATLSDLIQTFWINLHKHRRGIARAQDVVIWVGIRHSVIQLLRLQFIAATGQDCGDLARMGIYGLSGVDEWLSGQGKATLFTDILVLGTGTQWSDCVSRMAAQGAELCRILRGQWTLPTRLEELERTVLRVWQQFVVAHGYGAPDPDPA